MQPSGGGEEGQGLLQPQQGGSASSNNALGPNTSGVWLIYAR